MDSAATVLTAVRTYLGLSQRELAPLLGVTPAQVGHVEARRRSLAQAPWLRLMALAVPLPAPLGGGPPAPAADAPPPVPPPDDVVALRARQRTVGWEAAESRRELTRRQARVARYEQRRQALPALQTALASLAATDARAHARLTRLVDERAAETLPPDCTPTALALLGLRVRLLDAELTQLAEWLTA